MAINKSHSIAIILIIAALNMGCPKFHVCSDSIRYQFSVDTAISIYPDKDSIHIGDTIWIEMHVPTNLFDSYSSKYIDFSKAVNFGEDIVVGILTGGSILNPGTADASDSVSYILVNGRNAGISKTGVRNYFFDESNGIYFLKVGIVPKNIGKYYLGFGSPTGVYKKNDYCTKAAFNLFISNTNQHLYYYQENRPGYIMSDYERKRFYFFKVN